MKKIAYITKDLDLHGISTVVINLCLNIDQSLYKVDILTGTPINEIYTRQCLAKSIQIIPLGNKEINKIGYYKNLYKALKKGYDIVHVHGNSALMSIELAIAKKCGIKTRIAHSHNSSCTHMTIHRILLPFFKKLYTRGIACGYEAGKWLFGNDFIVIPNSINTKQFIFNSHVRNEIRTKYKIENAFVIGHVGCFNDQKNHIFIINVFKEIQKKRENAKLLLIGDGPNFFKIMDLIHKYKLSKYVIATGKMDDVWRFYNAMDAFIFPSLYEGFGITYLEAQINGLPCVISDRIPTESIINKSTTYVLPLETPAANWSDALLKENKKERRKVYFELKSKFDNYDIDMEIENICVNCYGKQENTI